MSDPLSAAGSIAGLVGLAIQLSQLSFQYISSVSGSSKAWSAYIQELSTLTSVLLRLQQASDHVTTAQHLLPQTSISSTSPAVPSTVIKECYTELDTLKGVLAEKMSKHGLRKKLEMLTWPFSEPETRKHVLMLHRFSSLLQSSLIADTLTVSVESYLHLRDEKDVKEFKEILNWFKPNNESNSPSPEIILESMCPGTRSDLLTSKTYMEWRDSAGAIAEPLLWINGPPGSGKTVIAAAIVDDLSRHPKTLVAHHFFRYTTITTATQDDDSLHDVLKHIIYQLLSQPSANSPLAITLSKTKKPRNASLPLKDLVDIICDIATSSNNPTYVVVDGLDEFAQSGKLLKQLKRLLACKVRVLVGSRDLPSIRSQLPGNGIKCGLDSCASRRDVEMYVEWRMDEDAEIEGSFVTEELKRSVVEKVVGHCNGSFLLARLIMDTLCNATTVKKIRTTLDSMPTNFADAYKATFDRILNSNPERRQLALAALRWVTYSRRPLDMPELQHAIASLEEEAPEYSSECLEPSSAILSACFGLVVHSKLSDTVDFVHSSARRFVLEQFKSDERTTNVDISRACLRYMAVPELAKGPCLTLDELKSRITMLPFLDYAARYYGYHAHSVENEVLGDLASFLNDDNLRESSWQMVHFVLGTESDAAQGFVAILPKKATVLHVAAFWGFCSLIKNALSTSSGLSDINKADSHGWSCLHWASSNGHYDVVEVLLQAGADVNAVDKSCWTPLFWAAIRGHDSVACLLLEHESNPLHQDNNGFTAAHWALLAGTDSMAALILDAAASSSYRDERPEQDPSFSIRNITVEQAKTIMDSLHRPKKPKNLFQLVAEEHDTKSFERLAEIYGEEPFNYSEMGLSTSWVSALWGSAKFVLSKGESGYWRRKRKESPIEGVRRQLLYNAIRYEDVAVAQSIMNLSRDLGKDLAADVVSAWGSKYVHVAAMSGSVDIMRLMVRNGLPLTDVDEEGSTALHYTCRTGSREIMQFLLDANVDVDARDKRQRTPLMILLLYGDWRTVHNPGDTLFLLDALVAKDASIHAKDSAGRQPLHYALASMDPTVIQRLLDLGSDPTAECEGRRSPLHVLAEGFYGPKSDLESFGFAELYWSYTIPIDLKEKVTKIVLQFSDPKVLQIETATKATAFASAIKSYNWMLAQALYTANAPFRSTDDFSDQLKSLAKNGFYELVQMLIDFGIALRDKNFLPAISAKLPAQKAHKWENNMVDVSSSGAFPRRDHAKVVPKLVSAGIDVNHRDGYLKTTALQLAMERGVHDVSYITALLDGGADPYTTTDQGLDSFDLALYRGKLDNLAALMQHAERDEARENWLMNWLRVSGMTPQGEQECFEACISAIYHRGMHATYDATGHTLLYYTAEQGNVRLAHELIKLGSNVNFPDPWGWTPLHVAVRFHHVEMVRFLIENGANVVETADDLSSSPGEFAPTVNALHVSVGACAPNHDLETRSRFSPEIVRLLLENGIDPNAKAVNVGGLKYCGVDGHASPLQIMFRDGPHRTPQFFEVVRLLIEFGSEFDGIVDRFKTYYVPDFEGFEDLWDVLRAGAHSSS
ncbi:ankyrin [Periconia macrospinosa]|uniref:Ankyrin n=1 Tax=Periconia macrospinosa TaxID=97972 RepID=A0A2V1DQ47_9PLEO|nr:ankyrin [Periconia macrospinosa]